MEKSKKIIIRVSEAQKETIKKIAQNSKMTISELFRKSMLSYICETYLEDEKQIIELIREFSE